MINTLDALNTHEIYLKKDEFSNAAVGETADNR